MENQLKELKATEVSSVRLRVYLSTGEVRGNAAEGQLHLSLDGSEMPYLLVPHTYMPGVESPFTMTVRADDVDDD